MTELERFSELPVALPLPTEPAPWGTLALQGLGEPGSEELELGPAEGSSSAFPAGTLVIAVGIRLNT